MTTVKAAQNGHWDLSAAAEASIAEAQGRPFRFAYKGDLFELPNQKLWPLSAMGQLAEDGDIAEFLRTIGAADGVYTRLIELGLTVGELDLLMNRAGEEAGVGNLPNSSPPARRGSTRR